MLGYGGAQRFEIGELARITHSAKLRTNVRNLSTDGRTMRQQSVGVYRHILLPLLFDPDNGRTAQRKF